ncbi:tetraacyldisaccharide 4'-kinase [Ectothiorhodospiraceae bacterium WFHF3C12]|nr:tetraacyldisaccharide 4'-kinase [Ectothiorhodospiraceae bacterium WFHF3C12]
MTALPAWWLRDTALSRILAPAGGLFAGLTRLRRYAFARGWLRSHRLPVPVVVVGNIFVGGTGKTPLVAALVERAGARGWRPGIVCRGYGGRARDWPRRVGEDTSPGEVGDEPVLLARRTSRPVMAGPDRVRAARALLAATDCDLLVLDDGLQHYRLARDAEIVVMDGSRGLGNGRCLPAGPLREPPSRLRCADAVLVNGPAEGEGGGFELQGATLMAVDGSERQRPLEELTGRRVHAVAGIGNPERFFRQLEAAGLTVNRHAFPDHHAFRPGDLEFEDDDPVVMTEKDAVKCVAFAPPACWYLRVAAVLDDPGAAAVDAVLDRLEARKGGGA